MSTVSPLDGAYAERVYAGVVGKLVGVYLGRPVEGWPFEDIDRRFGLIDRYVSAELGIPLIVADDDISGTFAFGRAVEDNAGRAVGAREVGRSWLNYIIEDRTILWWGGYGRSTEHTAYLNLKAGVDAPESGSIAVNGRTLAEQIGAQIFSDAFGMMLPGDPAEAARLTRAAASVSHDGVALDAAAFFGAMRAEAFGTADLEALIETGLREVGDARLRLLVEDVVGRVREGDDWRDTRAWVDENYGYARYPGPCHALSNSAMVIAALRAAGDDFGKAVAIASSVGFDTDSNAGTIGCLNGIRLGLDAIPAALRDPVADRAVVVSADGGEAITDAAKEARRIIGSAHLLRGTEQPAGPEARFDFGFRGSRHGFTGCPHLGTGGEEVGNPDGRGLRVSCPIGGPTSVSTPTFLDPADAMANFSTVASPTLYPTSEVAVRIRADRPVAVRLFALYDDGLGSVLSRFGDEVVVEQPQDVAWRVPAVGNLVPFRLGLQASPVQAGAELVVERVDWRGAPDDFRQRGVLLSSIWDTHPAALAPWVSSARNWEADFGSSYCVSHPGDDGVVTIGSRDWTDYAAASTLTLSLHRTAGLVVRSRGHRDYTAGVFSGGEALLVDRCGDERRVLAAVPFDVPLDTRLQVELRCVGDEVVLSVDGSEVARGVTSRRGGGGAGFLVERGTFTADGFAILRRETDSPRHPTSSGKKERQRI
ncbi:ADP-ribosylglycohydrolase family protein [Microbacterium sp.]|uniref:ADP-ribosylglycohydrolase family protein n=1 Tax=Microbacterium sp. TaxID=51671 RepID=UPI0033400C57